MYFIKGIFLYCCISTKHLKYHTFIRDPWFGYNNTFIVNTKRWENGVKCRFITTRSDLVYNRIVLEYTAIGEEALGFGIITYSVRFPALLESIASETKEIILYKIYISKKIKVFTLLFWCKKCSHKTVTLNV